MNWRGVDFGVKQRSTELELEFNTMESCGMVQHSRKVVV